MNTTPANTSTEQHEVTSIQSNEKVNLNDLKQNESGTVTIPPTPDEVLSRYAHLLITDSTPVPDPVPVVQIAGEIISTEGNITTVSGASKSGKSAFVGIIIAGAIADGDYDGLTEVEVQPNERHKAVIHIDTEQARHRHQRNLCAILTRAGLNTCPDYLHSFNFRELPLNDYKQATSDVVDAACRKHGGVHLIVIDGIADYIRDVNDPESSNGIVAYMECLAVRYACPIITIVHTNPGSDKERGHLGSQLQRKSESVLTIQTENDISTLQPKFLRNAGKGNIPLIQFAYDAGKGYHTYCGVRTPEQANRDAERLEHIREVVAEAFGGQRSYSYEVSVEAIMRASKKGMRTAKDMFREAKAHNMIKKGGDGNWRQNMDEKS